MFNKIIHHVFLIAIGIIFIAAAIAVMVLIVSNLKVLADLMLVAFTLFIAWMAGYGIHETYRLNRLKKKDEQERLLKKLQEGDGCTKG